jgi:DNA-binding response OmpR family regulator
MPAPDTLLLADDSLTMQRVVELTFAEQGIAVACVSDGQQAIELLTRQPPAVALISATLHRVNGFDVARYVRDQLGGRVPVILVAGAFDTIEEAEARAAGAAGVLFKPFEPAVVIKRVKELLGLKADLPESATHTPVARSGRLITSHDAPPRAVETPPSEVTPATPDTAGDPIERPVCEWRTPAGRP